jgi:hypothetical protein
MKRAAAQIEAALRRGREAPAVFEVVARGG